MSIWMYIYLWYISAGFSTVACIALVDILNLNPRRHYGIAETWLYWFTILIWPLALYWMIEELHDD